MTMTNVGVAAEMFDLSGQCALVTGASRGIGRTLAAALSAAGAQVVLAGRDADALERETADIRVNGGSAAAMAFDVTDLQGLRAAAARLDDEFDGPDILLHCAGIIDRSPFDDVEIDNWRTVVETNLTSGFVLAKEMSGRMLRKGRGRIINIGSVMSVVSKPNAVAYTASKHGLAGLTKSLAVELGPRGILVNAICPGFIRTDINLAMQQDSEQSSYVEARTPLRRWGETADLAGAAVFLASAASSFISGQLLVIDGGLTASI